MGRQAKKRPKQANGAGSIYEDKARGNWRVMVTLPNGRRRTGRAPNQAAALKLRNQWLGAAANGEAPPTGNRGLAASLDWWEHEVLPGRTLAPATVAQYQWALGIIRDGLGRARLPALDAEQVQTFLRGLADDGYSRNSVRVVRTTLAQVLKEAERLGYVRRNVAMLAHLPAHATPPAERDALTDDEARRLLAAAAEDRLAAYWTLALTTGARRGELLGLSWDRVDLTAGTLTIDRALRRGPSGGYVVGPTKTAGSVRTVRLGPSALAALKEHKRRQRREQVAAQRWNDTGLVFTTTVGTHLDPNKVRRSWDAICKAAGLVGRVPHELRHTAGSQAVDAGVPLALVADQLGHADVNMLARTYRHRTRPVVEGVAGVMEEFIAPKRAGRPR